MTFARNLSSATSDTTVSPLTEPEKIEQGGQDETFVLIEEAGKRMSHIFLYVPNNVDGLWFHFYLHTKV